MAERASGACTWNGIGYELLTRFYLRVEQWFAFKATERDLLSKTARVFGKALRREGFLPGYDIDQLG